MVRSSIKNLLSRHESHEIIINLHTTSPNKIILHTASPTNNKFTYYLTKLIINLQNNIIGSAPVLLTEHVKDIKASGITRVIFLFTDKELRLRGLGKQWVKEFKKEQISVRVLRITKDVFVQYLESGLNLLDQSHRHGHVIYLVFKKIFV